MPVPTSVCNSFLHRTQTQRHLVLCAALLGSDVLPLTGMPSLGEKYPALGALAWVANQGMGLVGTGHTSSASCRNSGS